MAGEVPGSPVSNGEAKRGQQTTSVPGSPQQGGSSPTAADRRPHGFTGRLTGRFTGRLSRMMSGLPLAQPANEYTSMQGRLQQEYADIQRRAQELMSTMDVPDGPMSDYDGARSPGHASVASSKPLNGSRPQSANFTIGAGVSAEAAARYHESMSQLGEGVGPTDNALRYYTANAFDHRDPETPRNAKDPGAGIMFEEERVPKKYNRRTEVNWVGTLAYIFFFCAFGFYLWIRITKTLDLGLYVGYGVFVLVVEIIGATTVMLYGVNLLWNPVIERFEEDPMLPGRPKVELPYHVRVLVPCYKEDLAIVRRTMMAAYDALLPAGCARTIYLCDDGKDPKKRAFCEALGPEVVYVSGRKRPAGEMNGKSGNINNCCSQIYPKGTKIPTNEVVCIFDADQVCSTSFYLKTLPLFDGGDDVGMVLSPQCFHNLNMHADIFNHSNVHFWEYMQPGYDALGFISCTGTNFVVRAAALKEVGGSPTYTLTEDFALGMALKMYGWHCRYVQEYLAIGEAPDQIRNCYQQRSRWCKGHFQIILDTKHCPLLQRRLNVGMKLMYASGVWSYVVGAISTPTFIIIPMITIFGGIFPIIINWWAALGVTIYGISTQLVLYYVRSPKHFEALWFANVGNQILWWTYVKACWRAVGSVIAKKGITFKTTVKGGGTMAAGNLRDLWMPLLCLILLFASVIYGLVDLASGATLRSPLIISILWAFYNMIPPLLVVWYAWMSTGTSLQWLCRIAMPLSFITMSLALAFMWFLYPEKFDYTRTLSKSMFYYEANMLGTLPAGYNIPWRGDAFTNDTTFGGGDLTGGWIGGGATGIVKMTIPTAFTTTMLAWSMLSFPKAYIAAGTVDSTMSQVGWGADYLTKTFATSTAATNTTNGTTGSIIYQVGNYTLLKSYWGHVEDLTGVNPTYSTSIPDGASDLGGQVVAALAAASLVFRGSDPAYAGRLLGAALGLYGEISDTANLGSYSNIVQQNCRNPGDPDVSIGGSRLPLCGSYERVLASDDGGIGGSAIDQYLSHSYYDDLAWAAAWLYRASTNNDVSYLIDAQAFYVRHINSEPGSEKLVWDYDNMYWAMNVFLAQVTNDDAAHERSRYFMKQWICGANPQLKFTDKGMAYNLNAQTHLATQTSVFLASIYGNVVHNSKKAASKRYLCWARAQMRYVMGDNKDSLVVGYGTNPPTHAANMPASCPDRPLPCSVFSAYLTPNPNPHVLTGALVQGEYGSDTFNDVRNLNDSVTSIELNAAFTGALAGLAKAPGTWEQCLQGYGPFTVDRSVCH